MSTGSRRARVRAFAKVNLDLRVLNRRSDGYHELRTVYQTISLADTIDIDVSAARRTSICLDSNVGIEDNLVVRAARLLLDELRKPAHVSFRLTKRIPMGAGLGGGSSDAAAVLLALPVLAGGSLPIETLHRLAAELGSDVPFFLIGGSAVGLGRGTEIYPLPDLAPAHGVVVAPPVHVSTADAYGALGRKLTLDTPGNIINSFQCCVWRSVFENGPAATGNDFEDSVLRQHPRLKSLKRKLTRLGADPAMMTGSGSAFFGLFRTREAVKRAVSFFPEDKVFPIALVSRARYRAVWHQSLAAYSEQQLWPPQSRNQR